MGHRNIGICEHRLTAEDKIYSYLLITLRRCGVKYTTRNGFVATRSNSISYTNGFRSRTTFTSLIINIVRNFNSPPYALYTFLCLSECRDFSDGLIGLTPFNLIPVMGHFGTFGRFFRYWNTNLPPGVRTIFRLLDFVLYDNRRLYVTLWTILIVILKISHMRINLTHEG